MEKNVLNKVLRRAMQLCIRVTSAGIFPTRLPENNPCSRRITTYNSSLWVAQHWFAYNPPMLHRCCVSWTLHWLLRHRLLNFSQEEFLNLGFDGERQPIPDLLESALTVRGIWWNWELELDSFVVSWGADFFEVFSV